MNRKGAGKQHASGLRAEAHKKAGEHQTGDFEKTRECREADAP